MVKPRLYLMTKFKLYLLAKLMVQPRLKLLPKSNGKDNG
jgi:hypothetical protein